MKIFLTGARGMVGRNVAALLPKDHSLIAPSKKELNLKNFDQLKTYLSLNKPDLIIHRDIFKKIFTEVDDSDLPEYIVIDILYKIVQFNADKTDILNQGSIFYHKCKMLVASQCLNPEQRRGYIFAKEYRHRDKTLRKKECIGIISFT